jgi:hypothetical protein
VLNRRIIISNNGNPLETVTGAVSQDEKAPSAQLGYAMVFGEECFTSTRVNHILRVTKPNTKRATIICPNSLSQIGAWGLRFNWPHQWPVRGPHTGKVVWHWRSTGQ